MSNKKIEALKIAAEKKKQDALLQTEKAIKILVEKKSKITVRSVAREAGVSPSYIYKYPELAYRIQTLRERQKYDRANNKKTFSTSNRKTTTQLHNRIKIIEEEKAKLNKEIKMLAANVSQMSKSGNSVERLKAQNIELMNENQQLKQQLLKYERKICELRDFILKQGDTNKYDRLSQSNNSQKKIQLVKDKD